MNAITRVITHEHKNKRMQIQSASTGESACECPPYEYSIGALLAVNFFIWGDRLPCALTHIQRAREAADSYDHLSPKSKSPP